MRPLFTGVFSSASEPSVSQANGAIDDDQTKPLNVIICGAGIGGLVAAIALRRQGHNVTILEQWDGAGETGEYQASFVFSEGVRLTV